MSDLCHAGFALWSAQQAEALRSAAREHSNAPLDWENLAEEIEGLGLRNAALWPAMSAP